MDPHSFIARAEAQRWLGIAEKLLISHDFVGSKTFAIRARESDPRLEPAEQILAIADTLLAAEKRVVGTNGAHQPDYYAILQLVRFVQDTEHITSQYRRLAVLLNPHQNRFPYSDQAFQLVNDAWAVLSNPMRKSMYDSDLDYPPQQEMNSLGFNLEQQHHQQQQQQQHHQQQQPHNFFSINHMGAGHEQELPEQQQQQTFQSRLHQSHQQQQQLQQHNFLSQPNPVRPLPVREQEHMFQHREQEHLFQQQVQPFQVTSPPHQQNRPSPQPPQQQSHIQSPPATPQSPFSWPQASQLSQPQQQKQQQPQSQFQQQLQHQQIKQEQQHQQQIKQEHQMKHEQQLKQQMKQEQQKQQQLKQQQLQQEQLKQQQLQQEKLKQQQLQEEQRKQQQLLEEQRKQQQLQEEQRKQQQLLEEQRKQQQLLEEQRKQQQLLEEQRKQQQLLEEQRKQQQLQEEQRKQQQLQEEQRKQQQLLEEQRKQQQLLEEQRKQQQLLEEQRKQQQLLEEQRKQQQLLEEQRKQQQLQEEQRKQQQLQEEQRKQQQLQEEQLKQQQLQEEQRKQQEQQQQESLKQNADPGQVNSNNGVREEETETEAETEPVDDSPTFWTACPYCFYMYEYPRVYAECTLRCDNCKRAFQAVPISSPPPIIEGQDAYFYCWGFFPLGLSMSHLQGNNNKGTNSNWTPFSSLHNTSNNVQNHLNEQAAPKENLFVNKSSGPRIYIDDITDDVFIGVSEPSSDSDGEWKITKKQKLKKMDKGDKERMIQDFKERIQVLALRAMYTSNGSVKNLKNGIPVQKSVDVPTVLVVETNKKNVGSNPRKQSGRVAKEMGKLDLNVEFNNNEGEETAPRVASGIRQHKQGEEDNIEGIEFFEGLDEYLSSLPILSVVNEEKVKVA